MYRVGRGESGEVPPLNDVCTSLFVIPKVFVTEGPVAIVSVQETKTLVPYLEVSHSSTHPM